MYRCPECNSSLRMARPQMDDQDAIFVCSCCSTVVINDAQPSAPASFPARSMAAVYVMAPMPTPVWLN